MLGFLCGGRVEGPESDIVGALLTCFHGDVARILCRRTDNRLLAEAFARILHPHVEMAQMHAVRANLGADIDAVIDDQRDVALPAQRQ